MSPLQVFVTGGNSGIGYALVTVLASVHGCKVYLGARSPSKGEEAVRAIKANFPSADIEFVQIDVTVEASVLTAASKIAEGSLHGLVNNAGVGLGTSNLDPGVDQSYLLETNLYGPKLVTSAFLSKLSVGGDARVVNIGSGSAATYMEGLAFHNKGSATQEQKATICDQTTVTWRTISSLVEVERSAKWANGGARLAYALSKACLASYTCVLAKEHPSLTITCVYPGFIDTAMTTGMLPGRARKTPEEATVPIRKCLFEREGVTSGHFYGPDGLRSPLNKERKAGEPEYAEKK